jgi:uncharacterized protein
LRSNFCLVKNSSSAFVIHFVGLKTGVHLYEFDVDNSFFEDLEYSLIEGADVHAQLSLEKKETMMIAVFTLTGTVHANCDRCNDPLELPINGTYRVVYKFGDEPSDDENLIVLDPEAFELDVAPQLYEFMCVSLPTRILHAPGECNEEMMALYDTYIVNPGDPEEDDDDDWDEDDDYDGDWDDEEEDGPEDGDEPDDDKPIDPRWSALKNLN